MPNSAALKSNVPFDLCGAVPGSNKISDILRHKKNFRHIQAPIHQTTVKCDDCFEEFSSIAEMFQQEGIQITRKEFQNDSLMQLVAFFIVSFCYLPKTICPNRNSETAFFKGALACVFMP